MLRVALDLGRTPHVAFDQHRLATPENGIALAKNSGRPGTRSSGCRTYGTIASGGCCVHAPTPASASDALISFRNSRRPFGSFHSEACSGNSRWRYSRKPGVSASSSRLRQIQSAARARPDAIRMAEASDQNKAVSYLMARRAAGQLTDARDVVFLHQPLAETGIVGRPLPGHVEDLVARPDVFRRVAMAVEAPLHLQRRLLIHQRHLVDPAVARRAADALASRGCCG